jgi:transcriptional regulator with XRE-family HTH domain
MLAGVSTDYYVRLEQGRERNPSDQVLDALARVLQLEPAAAEHLHDLVCSRALKHKQLGQVDQVSPQVLQLLEGLEHAVAFVVNHRFDVLAKNPLAIAHFAGLEHGDNLMRLTFLSPDGREFYRNWEIQGNSSSSARPSPAPRPRTLWPSLPPSPSAEDDLHDLRIDRRPRTVWPSAHRTVLPSIAGGYYRLLGSGPGDGDVRNRGQE